MSAVIAIRPDVQLCQPGPRSAWDSATEAARECAMARGVIARRVRQKVADGSSVRQAVAAVHLEIRCGDLDHVVRALGRIPSAPSLARWFGDFQAAGAEGLLPEYKGRVRQDYGWELRAQHLFRQASRPGMNTVAWWLREEGFASATNSRVRRYLKSLPSNRAETSPSRVGKHTYQQTIKPHHRRDFSDLAVGEAWVSDGHCFKAFVRHPITGKPFRPEVTPVLDVRSNYCYSFWIGEAESAMDTIYGLCSAMKRHDHVPTWFVSDPGPGFDNVRCASLFDRQGITHSKTLPGNARGKGFGEGFFHWLIERCAKRFATYCGEDRTDDALARMQTKINRGELEVPGFEEFKAELERFRLSYNAAPQPHSDKLHGQSPNDLQRTIQRNPLTVGIEDLLRPRTACTVRHWEVRFRNRFYRAAELAAYERRQVEVEYDENDEAQVWVRDDKGRLICIAQLTAKTPFAKESVAADVREKSRLAKLARLERRAEEVNGRARLPLSAAAVVEALEGDPPAALPSPSLQLLDLGHSFTRPAAAPVPPRAARSISAATVASLRSEMEQDAAESETAADRFARALRLERAADASDADARWLAIYQTSSEYHAHRLLQEEFGAPHRE